MLLDDVLLKLNRAGLRRTQVRRALLGVLLEEQSPLSCEEIHLKLRSHGCDLPTIYRNVFNLEQVGIIKQRVDAGVRRFELPKEKDD